MGKIHSSANVTELLLLTEPAMDCADNLCSHPSQSLFAQEIVNASEDFSFSLFHGKSITQST